MVKVLRHLFTLLETLFNLLDLLLNVNKNELVSVHLKLSIIKNGSLAVNLVLDLFEFYLCQIINLLLPPRSLARFPDLTTIAFEHLLQYSILVSKSL